MKKLVLFIITLSVTLPLHSAASGETPDNCITNELTVHTESTAYNWYCKKTSDHTQPPLDSLLSFSENCDAYYIDKKHCEYDQDEKVIYLTFDAGYENGNIEKILDILKEKNVPGAFFILENLIKRNPELVKRMNEEGHLICNHTASHRDMSQITDLGTFKAELEKLETVCKDTTGVSVAKFYRPPEGRFSEINLQHAKELGYKTIFWSFAYVDWDNNAQMSEQEAIDKILKGTHNGEIILLHPTSATNAAILGQLIDAWTAEGFTFGTLNDLASCD